MERIYKMVHRKKKKKNIGSKIVKFKGTLKGDKEYDRIMKEVRKGWGKWTKKYL